MTYDCLYRLGDLYYHNKPKENPQLIALFALFLDLMLMKSYSVFG
jgi:hypothetical protein